VSVTCVSPAKLDSKWGVVAEYYSMSAVEGSVRNKKHLNFDGLISARPPIEGPAFLGYNAAFGNHYHVILEWLPTFLEFRDLVDPTAMLLLPESQRSNGALNAGLALLGIESKVRFLKDSASNPVGFERLYYSDYLHGTHNYMLAESLVNFYKEIGRSVSRVFNVPTPERLYISRADSKNRTVENESLLIAELCADHRFVAVTLAGMPFPLQVLLFNNARVVISPHGAGLANLVFKGDGDRAICELQPAAYKNPCFERIAQTYGDTYTSVSMIDVASGEHQHHLRSRLDDQALNEVLAFVNEA
jgi:hypothetical protein